MKLRVIHFSEAVVHPGIEGVSRSYAVGQNDVESIEVLPQLLAVCVTTRKMVPTDGDHTKLFAKVDTFYYPLAKSIGMGALQETAKK